MRRRNIFFIMGIILIALILVKCTMQDKPEDTKEIVTNPEIIIDQDEKDGSEDTNKSKALILDKSLTMITIKKPIQITPIYLNTFEDVYIYYSMLKEAKDNLRDKCTEFFLSIDLSEINQKGFSKYYGDLGRELIRECQRFEMLYFVGTGVKVLERHTYRYHEFYVNNEEYYRLGENLIETEGYLDNNDYESALKSIRIVYKNIMSIREKENEEKGFK